MNNFKNKSIILFDGVCCLCNATVNFIIKHDKNERYLFASLQSDAAKEILLQFPEKKIALNTVVLIENDCFYEKSTAAVMIVKHLNGWSKYAYYMHYIPKTIRDRMYDFIAKNRYQWFGKNKTCIIPSPDLAKRFL